MKALDDNICACGYDEATHYLRGHKALRAQLVAAEYLGTADERVTIKVLLKGLEHDETYH